MVASTLEHSDLLRPRDRSRFDGSDHAAELELVWRDLAVSCWNELHPGEEPTATDLPDPADVAVCVEHDGPLAGGAAWDEFLSRWDELASRIVALATVHEWARLEVDIITYNSSDEFAVLAADQEKVGLIRGEDFYEAIRLGSGRYESWADFLSKNIMGAGAAHTQLLHAVIDELRGVSGLSSEGPSDKGAPILAICDYFDTMSAETRGKHPVEPLIQAWQKTPAAERIWHVTPDRRKRRRKLPSTLVAADPVRGQSGAELQTMLFDRGIAERVGAQGQLPGIRDAGKTPALPLELWDLGAASATRGSGRGAPLALRLFVESILAVSVERRNGLASLSIPLGELKAKLYPNDTHIGRKAFYERLCRAVEILQSREARIPWYDPTTGTGGLRQVVSITNLPDGPDSLNHDVKVVIDLPPNSHVGPLISDNLGKWGVCNAAAYRALLNLAYQWYEPGRTHYPVGVGMRLHWQRSYDPEKYDLLTDTDLISLCYPAGVSSKQRAKRLAEAKRTIAELADAGELQIVPVGTSQRERRILPPPSRRH